MQNQEPAAVRLILLMTLPALITGIIIFTILFSEFSYRSASQQSHYGKATARQFAHYIAPYVVENNLLSLNIVASDLVKDDYIQFVAVYDDSDQLVAQAGRKSSGTKIFTSEITFQDSVVGFARIAVINDPPPDGGWALVLVLLLGPIALLGWRYPLLITRWLYAVRREETETTSDTPVSADDGEGTNEAAESCECILVTRVRPAHHMERQFERLFHAAALYGGIVEQTTPEELVVHFDGPDAMFRATSTGLLIRELCNLLPGNIKFGGTLDVLSGDPAKIRKSASYLASIAEGDLLIARGEGLVTDRVLLQTFHHSLVDSEDLCRVTSLSDQALIDGQAKQLL